MKERMITKDPKQFSEKINGFIKSLRKHSDMVSVEVRGSVTTITYEDWSEQPSIKNKIRKVLPSSA